MLIVFGPVQVVRTGRSLITLRKNSSQIRRTPTSRSNQASCQLSTFQPRFFSALPRGFTRGFMLSEGLKYAFASLPHTTPLRHFLDNGPSYQAEL